MPVGRVEACESKPQNYRMRRAFKYRLWTTANQARELGIMLETHRRLYNAALAQRRTAWAERQESVRYAAQSAWFKQERATNPYFARVNFSSAQATLRRLDASFQNFFRRAREGGKPGYPRFKAPGRFGSILFPAHGDGIRLTGDRLRVQHVGTIRVKLHRPVVGEIRTLSLKEEADKWYLVVCCDLGEVPSSEHAGSAVGIDVGLEAFLTTSEGERLENPCTLQRARPALRRANRRVSRRKKGGRNRRKAVRQLRRHHSRVRNLRREHHLQVARSLVLRYALIAVECLSVKNMLRNRRMARSIADAGWAGFIGTLTHLAESAGARVVEVDPRGTSQDCSGCGARTPKSLRVRVHACPHCGLRLHRDHNAALNILQRAQARMGPAGLNVG